MARSNVPPPSAATLAGKRKAGWFVSEEQKRKISATLTGRKLPLETKRKMARAHRTPELRRHMSRAIKRHFAQHPEARETQRQNQRNTHLGRKCSPETLARMRRAQRRPEVLKKTRGNAWTSRPELALTWALFDAGVECERQVPMFGFLCDLTYSEARLIIEADGDYWHQRPEKVTRDRHLDREALASGWSVLHVPEHLIRSNLHGCAEKIAQLVGQ